ncbi:MAG: hypothetical protein KJZ85_18760 [Rhodobacteraceae bacterium]|jgi:hypothetical protein|nr:hypothetical protein [Paracoccaceae bacterium]
MPALVRLYIRHVAIGFLLAVLFTAALLSLDVANLRHLVTHVAGGWLAVVMLVAFNGIVFAGVQFGIAVMGMAESPPREPPAGRRPAPLSPAPAPAALPARPGPGREPPGRPG